MVKHVLQDRHKGFKAFTMAKKVSVWAGAQKYGNVLKLGGFKGPVSKIFIASSGNKAYGKQMNTLMNIVYSLLPMAMM